MTEHVNIINSTMGGTYFIEGRAKVIEKRDDDMMLVAFDDYPNDPVERFVDPLAQGDDVAEYVARLNDPE